MPFGIKTLIFHETFWCVVWQSIFFFFELNCILTSLLGESKYNQRVRKASNKFFIIQLLFNYFCPLIANLKMSSIFFPLEAIVHLHIHAQGIELRNYLPPSKKKKKNSVGDQKNKLALKLDLVACSPLCHTPILKVLP